MAGPSWNDAWDVGKEVLKHAGKKTAEEAIKGMSMYQVKMQWWKE